MKLQNTGDCDINFPTQDGMVYVEAKGMAEVSELHGKQIMRRYPFVVEHVEAVLIRPENQGVEEVAPKKKRKRRTKKEIEAEEKVVIEEEVRDE